MNKTDISKNRDTLCRYRESIIEAYNHFVNFICENYSDVSEKEQQTLDSYLSKAREIFAKCLNNLKCSFVLPDENFVQIEPTSIGEVPNKSKPDDEMAALNSIDLLNLVNRHFPQKYSGNPLGLTSFLDGIRILRRFATTAALQTDLFEFLLSKLDNKAREAVTANVDTLDKLVDVLRSTIKPDDSTIIEGRIAALRYSYAKEDEFMVKAEQLAEALHRTLIIEGVTPEKANQMTIASTVALCRRSTTSPIVKSALIAKAFTTPKEVISTLVVENGVCVKEQQILNIQKVNREKRNSGQGNGRGRGFRKNDSGGSGQNGSNGGSSRQHGQWGQSNRNRGGQHQNYNNNNGQRSAQNRNYQQYPQQNVRVVQSGNGLGPQQMSMGAQTSTPTNNPFPY